MPSVGLGAAEIAYDVADPSTAPSTPRQARYSGACLEAGLAIVVATEDATHRFTPIALESSFANSFEKGSALPSGLNPPHDGVALTTLLGLSLDLSFIGHGGLEMM